MREIKKIGVEYIEEYLDIYLNAYPAYKTRDEECRGKYRKKITFDMTHDKDVDFVGMIEDGKLIALMKLVNYKMNIYGKMQKAVGLMSLAVHPLHKKKGVALEMVKYYEEYSKNTDALVDVLLPFNMGFYRKMGYGLGSKLDEYYLNTIQLPAYHEQSHLRLLDKGDIQSVLDCHNDFAEKNHGMLKKFEEEIRDVISDFTTVRVGYFDGDKLLGYVAYNYKETHESNYTENMIVVDELIYSDGKVLRELLAYLRNQADLAQRIIIRSGEAEFYHLFDNPADLSRNYTAFGYIQTNTSLIGNMYKVLNPKAFVEATSYRMLAPVDIDVRFAYIDELDKSEHEIVIFVRKNPERKYGTWAVSDNKNVDVSVKCNKGDLSSLLMNSARLGQLISLGAVKIDKPEYASLLDMVFYFGQKPYSNSDF